MDNCTHEETLEGLDFKLDIIIADFDGFKMMFHGAIKARDKEIAELKSEVKGLNVRVQKLEDKVADGDAKHRENNFILSGDGIRSPEDNENCFDTVREVLQQKLKLIKPSINFVSAARLGKPNSAEKSILVEMKSPSDKDNVKKACKAMKPNFFANGDFSAEKRTILYVERQAKKKFPSLVKGYSSTDERLFAYARNDNENEITEVARKDRRVSVGNLQKLKAFCTDTLSCGLQTFIKTWPH